MTIGELKRLIANEPEDTLVILQKDSEGNDYSPCDGWDTMVYVEESKANRAFVLIPIN